MKAAHRVSEEYARFTDALGRILRVPYSAMKAKLEAEKKRKKRVKRVFFICFHANLHIFLKTLPEKNSISFVCGKVYE